MGLAHRARDLGAHPPVADASGEETELGQVLVDAGHAAGHVDDHVRTEHEADADLPVTAVTTAVGDGLVEEAPDHGRCLGEVRGERPEQTGEPGTLGAGRLAERRPYAAGERDRLRFLEVPQRAGLDLQEELQHAQTHPGPVAEVFGVVRVVAERDRTVDPGQTLGAVVAQPPEPAHGEDQAVGGGLVGGGDDGAVQGGPDVVQIALDPLDPRELLGRAESGLGGLGEGREVGGVSGLGGGEDLRGLGGALDRVLVDGLQEPVAHLTALGGGGDDEGLVDQGAERVGGARGEGLRGGEVPAAGEDRDLPEQGALVGVEEVPGPVDDRAEGLLAGQDRAGAGGEETEAVVETVGDLARGEQPEAGGGQFDGEGQAVEAAADLVDGRAAVPGEVDVGAYGAGALGEEAVRGVRRQGFEGADRLPGTPRGSRLVARMRSSGQSVRRVSARAAAASITCSQLSRTRRKGRRARCSTSWVVGSSLRGRPRG